MSEKKQLKLSARAIANMGAIKKRIASDNPVAADRVIYRVTVSKVIIAAVLHQRQKH